MQLCRDEDVILFIAVAQFALQLEQRYMQHCGSIFDHRISPDRIKRSSMFNYSLMFLYAPIQRQVLSAMERVYVWTGRFRE